MTPLNYGARGSPGTDMWARHGPLNLNQHRTWGEMNAGLIILRVASLGRDAQNDESVTELVLRSSVAAATPCLRRSSSSVAAAAPSQQRYNLALKWSSHRRVPPRGAAGSTSRRDAAAPRGGTRAARSISSVLCRSSQLQQQAPAVSRDDERSTGAFLLKLFRDHSKWDCSSSSCKYADERAGFHSPCEIFFLVYGLNERVACACGVSDPQKLVMVI